MSSPWFAYALTLALHTYLRWLLLGAGLAAWGLSVHGAWTARAWTRLDERCALAFVALTDLQLLAGLLLYLWFSPLREAAWALGLWGARAQPSLLFFGYVHPSLMVVGFLVVHATRARSRRAGDDRERFRTMARGLSLWLLVVLAAIPWPWLSYGRPLLRTGG